MSSSLIFCLTHDCFPCSPNQPSSLLQGVADALEAMARGDPPARGRREGSRSRSPCSAPGNDGKGKGKGKNKGKHLVRGKGKGGNPAVDMENLVRSAAQCEVDEGGSVGVFVPSTLQSAAPHLDLT